MSLSSIMNIHAGVDADADVGYSTSVYQEHDSEDQPPIENQEQSWLTIRRRCELCKQRKVRILAVTTQV